MQVLVIDFYPGHYADCYSSCYTSYYIDCYTSCYSSYYTSCYADQHVGRYADCYTGCYFPILIAMRVAMVVTILVAKLLYLLPC